MSTPIYKVSDGSTITFKNVGPLLQATLVTSGGQVFNGLLKSDPRLLLPMKLC